MKVPLILLALVAALWLSDVFALVAAGVALFLLGMTMLEDGFRRLGGGLIDAVMLRATATRTRAIAFGAAATALMQSSSLVSIITMSFLSAGMIPLAAGVGIIFGANIGTTTGAWLIAGVGLKVDIGLYALPLLVIGTALIVQAGQAWRATGGILLGIGLIFLGVAYIKDGFDSVAAAFDLSQLALTGLLGLAAYLLVGIVGTVVLQSSHAAMLLVITALSAAQITYDNALAVAIGANVGTVITALIASINSGYQGKRLALAHLVFNTVTAGAALLLLVPLRISVDFLSEMLGIGATDFGLKLALFHTLFNALGVAIIVPFMPRLLQFIETRIRAPRPTRSQPKYLTRAVEGAPIAFLTALENETRHLQTNAANLIAEGLNLRLADLVASQDLALTVARGREPIPFDYERRYEETVKPLYSAILDYSVRQSARELPAPMMHRMQELRDLAGEIVRAVKAVKHMQANTSRFLAGTNEHIINLYDLLRVQVAQILVLNEQLMRSIENTTPTPSDTELKALGVQDHNALIRKVEPLLRALRITPEQATSFLNDAGYANVAFEALVETTQLWRLPPIAPVGAGQTLD